MACGQRKARRRFGLLLMTQRPFLARAIGDICSWKPSACDGTLADISLELRSRGLTGTVPSELGQLGQLHRLFLSDNQTSGTLPSELGLLTNLIDLNPDQNAISGTIPSEIGRLNAEGFGSLQLGDNSLSGSLPSEIWQLTASQDSATCRWPSTLSVARSLPSSVASQS
jgi:hypothetical protein